MLYAEHLKMNKTHFFLQGEPCLVQGHRHENGFKCILFFVFPTCTLLYLIVDVICTSSTGTQRDDGEVRYVHWELRVKILGQKHTFVSPYT